MQTIRNGQDSLPKAPLQQLVKLVYYNLYSDELPSINNVMQDRATAQQAIRPSGFSNLDMLPSTYAIKEIETFLMAKTRGQD